VGKVLIFSVLFLAGCKCPSIYDTSSDQGKCWKECAISAAASDRYWHNLDNCVQIACQYPSKQQCP